MVRVRQAEPVYTLLRSASGATPDNSDRKNTALWPHLLLAYWRTTKNAPHYFLTSLSSECTGNEAAERYITGDAERWIACYKVRSPCAKTKAQEAEHHNIEAFIRRAQHDG